MNGLQSVRVVYPDLLLVGVLVDTSQKMATGAELQDLAIADIYALIWLELVVKYVMHSNLVDERRGHLVAGRMHGHRDQWLGCLSDRLVP